MVFGCGIGVAETVAAWEPGTELFEYMCQQANYATELMVGDREAVGKTTNVVP